MNNIFPRIYSLSTIGIKQHFNCDYLFHPHRTDFSGESGSGKSMVADMIQLILVGSSVFKSATESNNTRDPKGMVLESRGNKYGFGYIFLNIEVTPNKFIPIGVFIESTHNSVQHFIIQNGYNWEKDLTPLTKPVFFKDLLINSKICTIEELQGKLNTCILKSLSRKKYHQLLFDNEILSLDLSTDKKTLENYARILRAFSRGKGFKKDSDTLKQFLFGDDDQTKLMQKYHDEVEGINSDFLEHQRYKQEIETISSKQNLIEDLADLYKEYLHVQEKYLTIKNIYWKDIQERSFEEHKEKQLELLTANTEQNLIRIKELELEIVEINKLDQYNKELKQLEEEHFSIKEIINSAKENYINLDREKRNVEIVEGWLKNYDNSLDIVKEWYYKEQAYTREKNILQNFISYLQKNNQLLAFEKSNWLTNFSLEREQFKEEANQLEVKIKSLESLNVFTNLQNEDSLAKWALENLNFPLSYDYESVLIHFQEFPRTEPDTKNRYLPFPKDLFENLTIKKKTDDGFWIDLDGVYEFIKYVPTQLLNIDSPEKINELLFQLKANVQEQLINQKSHLENIVKLKDVLFDFSGLEEAIMIFSKKEDLFNFNFNHTLNITEEQFNSLLSLSEKKDDILNEHKEAEEYLNIAISNSRNYEIIKGNLIEKIATIEEILFKGKKTEGISLELLIHSKNGEINSCSSSLQEIINCINAESSFIENIKSVIQIEKISLITLPDIKFQNLSNILKLKREFELGEKKINESTREVESAKLEFNLAYGKHFIFLDNASEIYNPDEGENNLKQLFERAFSKFEAKFNIAKDSLENKEQLEGYNIGLLAHRLLPTVFESSKINESLIKQKIADRIEKLRRDIEVIGSRKVEILKRVFTEVHKTYQEYLQKVNGIDKYFKNENHGITGGNRASLKHKKSTDYPDKWMAPFRKQLDEQFYSSFGLFAELRKEVDINDIMMKAFKAAGGSDNVTPEDLLNPKSYFDLEFDMKLENGESNAGSSGQTYTANALLCLARLSLIEDKKNKGLHIMPIDEAEGLGGNYDMLHALAKTENYQVVSMSIETAGDINDGEQYIYIMNENKLSDETNYVPPLGIFSKNTIIEDINDFIYSDNIVNEQEADLERI